MKLIIQIPCYNEEDTLPLVLKDLPKKIKGIDVVELQIIDDGSTDKTVEVAERFGVHHIVSFKSNRGLAAAFKAGVDNAIANEADILVNTDGDNQYNGKDIVKLVQPIINGEADIVIGCRPIEENPEFSFTKKKLHMIGSWILRKISNTSIKDPASGFRAYDKNAILTMNIYSSFSYCMETLIQAGRNNLKVIGVCIGVNPKTRDSRLFRNNFQYIWEQAKTMLSIFILYRPNIFFNFIAFIILLFSIMLVLRYLLHVYMSSTPSGAFWPSIVLAGIMLVVSFQIYLTGLLASLISSIRMLSEDTNFRIKNIQISILKDKASQGG